MKLDTAYSSVDTGTVFTGSIFWTGGLTAACAGRKSGHDVDKAGASSKY